MNNKFNSPDFKTIIYKLNIESGRYEKQPERVPFDKLPIDLKVETTWNEHIKKNGATEVITGRIKGGKREFFTGLIHTPNFANWFFGNDYHFTADKKKNSLIIFQFTDNNRELKVYYFNSFYKDSREERITFVISFIKSIQ
jgi:hypothetical protein